MGGCAIGRKTEEGLRRNAPRRSMPETDAQTIRTAPTRDWAASTLPAAATLPAIAIGSGRSPARRRETLRYAGGWPEPWIPAV